MHLAAKHLSLPSPCPSTLIRLPLSLLNLVLPLLLRLTQLVHLFLQDNQITALGE